VRRYSRLLGVFAGDLVLAAPALGGVWLMGGVLAGLGPRFDRQQFLKVRCERALEPPAGDVPVRMTGDDRLACAAPGPWPGPCHLLTPFPDDIYR